VLHPDDGRDGVGKIHGETTMSDSHFVEPASDRIIVADIQRETTIDGIVMPDNMREQEMIFGLVIFVGPSVSAFTKVQDTVMYGPYAGKNIVVDGVQFRIVREGQIEGYIRQKRTVEGMGYEHEV
jgi:chaperonin GroES